MDQKQNLELPFIGWREWTALPDLGIERIKAKIDTGARTSVLHAFSVETYREKGALMAHFKVHPLQKNTEKEIDCYAEVIDNREVTDSGGHKEQRCVISSKVVLGDTEWPIEISLTSRDIMTFRMLLGRTAIEERFIVNPSASFLMGKWKG